MTGWSEVRVNGPRRHHYRLFYRLDYDAKDRPKSLLVVVNLAARPDNRPLSCPRGDRLTWWAWPKGIAYGLVIPSRLIRGGQCDSSREVADVSFHVRREHRLYNLALLTANFMRLRAPHGILYPHGGVGRDCQCSVFAE